MDLAQFAGQSVLQVVEELLDAGEADARQMAEAHLLHVEHEHQAGVRSELVQARIDRHEERLDGLVEVIVERLRVGQPMEDDRQTVRTGRNVEVVPGWFARWILVTYIYYAPIEPNGISVNVYWYFSCELITIPN